jgi:hypothetical protein
LFERHAQVTKSALAKKKCVKVEDFVANRHGQAWSRRCNRKFPRSRDVEFLTDDPETLCFDWLVPDR